MAGDGGSQAPMAYNPTGQAQADQSYQALTGNAANWASSLGSVLPQLQTAVGGVTNNQYAGGAQSTANNVSQIGTNQVAPSQFAASSAMNGLGGLATPLAQQIIQMGFDPQSTLYNQQYQQNLDQSNAINAMNGVSGTPYGAGLSTQSAQNFNANWQNQQLGRALSALGGYGTAVGAGAQAYNTGSNLGNTGLATLQQSGSQPYNTSIGIAGDQMSALQQLISGTQGVIQPSLSTANSLGQYLNLGQSATSINDNATAQNNAQQQNFWGGLASLFGGGGMFGGGGTFGGGSGSWITNLGGGGGSAAASGGSSLDELMMLAGA